MTPKQLESMLDEVVGSGTRAWPSVRVESDRFRAYIRERLPESPSANDFKSLHVADLYLAYACGVGSSAALVAIDDLCTSLIAPVLERRVGRDTTVDILQCVRAEVLAPGGTLRQYRGEAPLKHWLKLIAVRMAIRAAKRIAREVPIDDEARIAREMAPDAEVEYAKQVYAAEFKLAVTEALQSLGDRERTLLWQHVIDGLSAERIAALYGVHRVTASNWLAKIRETLATRTRRSLKRQLGIQSRDICQLADLVQSRLDVTLRRVLANRAI